jgi:hypothetical protein
MRVRKLPANRRRGYYESNYNRFAPLTEADHADAAPEQWAAGTITAWQTAFTTWLGAVAGDGGAGADAWAAAVFSPEYHIRVSKPAGLPISAAAQLVLQVTASAYVGTQVTRRYSPTGLVRGA